MDCRKKTLKYTVHFVNMHTKTGTNMDGDMRRITVVALLTTEAKKDYIVVETH